MSNEKNTWDLEFVKALSFDGDGLSDTCEFKALNLDGNITFRVSNFSGSKEDTTNEIDTIAIYSDKTPIGMIVLGKTNKSDFFFSAIDLNNDGKINEEDHDKINEEDYGKLDILRDIIRKNIEIKFFDKYFGVKSEELKQ